MKKVAWFIVAMVLCVPVFAQDASDMGVTEVKPDVAKWILDTVLFKVITQSCEVRYRPVDTDGNVVGQDVIVSFVNRADDPETPEDETLTEFTQLVTAINNGDNIKNTIKNAVKIKLGIVEP